MKSIFYDNVSFTPVKLSPEDYRANRIGEDEGYASFHPAYLATILNQQTFLQ